MRESAEHALGRRLSPAGAFSRCVEYRKVFRIFGHQLATEFERVLTGGLREFVDKALHVNGVLVDVYAAPEARWYVGVAHGVINQQVGNGVVAKFKFPRRVHALKDGWIHAIDQRLGSH